jgi:integrase
MTDIIHCKNNGLSLVDEKTRLQRNHDNKQRCKVKKRLVSLKADLNNPESVKEAIALQGNWKDSMKEVVVFAYYLYAKWLKLELQRPRYKAIRQLPFIPQEREIDNVIAGCNKEIALFLQIGKDTGARSGEIYRLQGTDIDFEGRTLSLIAEKEAIKESSDYQTSSLAC